MSKQFNFVYSAPPVTLLPSAADAAGRTSAYKSLANVSGKVVLFAKVNQGNAAQVTFTPLQAKDDSGTGSKAIPAVPIFFNINTAAGDALTPETAAASFQTDVGLTDKLVAFEFDPAELDLFDGFNHIAVETSASNAANITSAWFQAIGRFQGQSPPASEV